MADAESNDAAAAGQANPEKRRRRPPLACIACRRRKVRCDRKMPCQNCIRARRAANCAYVPDDRIEPRDGLRGFRDGINGRSADKDDVISMSFPSPLTGTAASTPAASHRSTGLFAASTIAEPASTAAQPALAERIRQLEEQLAHVQHARHAGASSAAAAATATANPPPETPKHSGTAGFLGEEHWQIHGGPASRPPRSNAAKDVSNSPVMMAKNRYFGPSHWIHGVVLFPRNSFLMLLLENLKSDNGSETYRTIAETKVLGRAIKAARLPRLQLMAEFGQHMPSRELADSLLDDYFRTFESVYRILHVPSFRLEYERYWQTPKAARSAFVIQLQLCLALGAASRDETFSLRNLAVRWIYEARMWLIMQPSEKSHVNLSGLQVRCLLHLARQICSVSPDLIWCEAGTLMRMALYIGLHRDPDHLPKMSLLAAETRRRLWATILELLVQSSIECGGPPLMSEDDYDVKPPGNYNDEDLLAEDDAGQRAAPHPVATLTDASVQIALLGTLKIRLQIASYLNEFRSVSSYDKTLVLNSGLTAASRSLDTLLRVYRSQTRGLSTFQLCETEHVMQRYFLALHLPWLSFAKDDPRYFLSRKLCVEIGLRNQSTAKAHGYMGTANGAEPDDFGRLLICASGSHRYTGTQCLILLTLHIFWEFEEHRQTLKNLGVSMNNLAPGPASTPFPTPGAGLSPDGSQLDEILIVLGNLTRWMRCRIQAGEVNVKGYLFGRTMLSEVEGLQHGLSDDELRAVIYKTTNEASKDAFNIVKQLHSLIPQDVSGMMPTTATPAPTEGSTTERNATLASADATQFVAMNEELRTMDPGSGGEMTDWEWDMLQNPNLNLNFRLGGMELMLGDLGAY